jgi:hypothetical protein
MKGTQKQLDKLEWSDNISFVNEGWVYFNKKCKKETCYYDFVPYFVEEFHHLPIECRQCHKALIFWKHSGLNAMNFRQMLEKYPITTHGKYNDGIVVFYLQNKVELDSFLQTLRVAMSQFQVEGQIQWRISGRYWQDDYPHFFKSAKELYPTTVDHEISISQWLSQNDRMSKLIAKIAEEEE